MLNLSNVRRLARGIHRATKSSVHDESEQLFRRQGTLGTETFRKWSSLNKSAVYNHKQHSIAVCEFSKGSHAMNTPPVGEKLKTGRWRWSQRAEARKPAKP